VYALDAAVLVSNAFDMILIGLSLYMFAAYYLLYLCTVLQHHSSSHSTESHHDIHAAEELGHGITV
jgi:hypothetical protein